ncbi:ATP-dependent DNA helicase [Segatella copri]|uniref:ATP-dependent DNA helicase n=1 Tax=Segatella copri TaxID=165179 RepID=UPI0022319078|nr:AAA family ATPase [Segatella copri]MCW4073384.1 AAA family ATPase [Segatella copri]
MMELTIQQNKVFEQIKAFLNSDASVFILRGYAGTGKTTMVKVIADYIEQTRQLAMMAPTGRAARVLAMKTGHTATTIHKAIYSKAHVEPKKVKNIAESEFKFVFSINNSENGGNFVAIVDEASMVCSRKIEHELFMFGTDNLMEDLLTFVRPNFGGKVIFVGDPAQLPPVGESVSNALRAEYFKEKGLKVIEAELTEVLRQKDDSVILKNAMMIRDLLKKDKRNQLVFEEQKDDVETVPSEQFLDKYLNYRKESGKHDSVIICYSNKSANRYNRDIRKSLYGGDVPLQENDILLITQNNYRLDRMNGEFVPVLSIGERIQQSAPVYAQIGGKKERIVITLNFIKVTVPNGDGNPIPCMLLEDLLTSDTATISIDENRALYINFCMRNPNLKQGTESFAEALLNDEYYNAIRAKYGYAVTGHKCQGGEWGKVFVDYTGRTGLDDDSLRWAYTATTRAQKTLYVTNLPHITPFSKFRIEPIQKCKNIAPECRILNEVPPTPFHNKNVDNGIRAKYHCIAKNMEYTPYRIISVQSRPYLEIYNIQTPDGVDRYDLFYKAGDIFQPAKAASPNQHTPLIEIMLNDEQGMSYKYNYIPSDESHNKLLDLIRSACDTINVQITNVVEHAEDFSTTYYMRTSGTFSYIKVYVNSNGFITYAKPMSLKGKDDGELSEIIEIINSHFV